MLQEIERHALARQHGAGVAIDVHQHGLGVDRGAIAHRGHDLDLGRKLAEAGGGERQARDGAGLRATITVRLGVPGGMVAIDVMSPARPRSSASARVIASSISSGEIKPPG